MVCLDAGLDHKSNQWKVVEERVTALSELPAFGASG
jgi:hypothetical protein